MNLDQHYPPYSIRTYTGRVFDAANLTADMICIEDIAHGLANTARFGGHTHRFYSVAQHSIKCAEVVSPENKLAALLHDASEAYIGDMPSPIKSLLPDYKALEEKIMKVIAEKWQFSYPLPEEIKAADKELLSWEWNNLVVDTTPVIVYTSHSAEVRFLNLYHEIMNEMEENQTGIYSQKSK